MRRREEKKNTMLLTVIAVATLLVAVVGATFAYFSLSVSGTANTTATVTAGNLGQIELKGTDTTYALTVSALDMVKPSTDKTYYAIKSTDNESENEGTETGGVWKSTENTFTVATATLSDGAEDTNYTCPAKVTVKLSGKMATDATGKLKAGDAFLKITGLTGDGLGSNIDLSTILEDASKDTGKVYTGTFDAINKTQTTQNITASVWLVNKSDQESGDQSYLAGESLTITITAEGNGACTIASSGAGA